MTILSDWVFLPELAHCEILREVLFLTSPIYCEKRVIKKLSRGRSLLNSVLQAMIYKVNAIRAQSRLI